MFAARVIDFQAARAERERRQSSLQPRRFVWMPMVVWVPIAYRWP